MVCSGDQSSSTETQTGGLSVKMVRQAEDRNAYAFFFFFFLRGLRRYCQTAGGLLICRHPQALYEHLNSHP